MKTEGEGTVTITRDTGAPGAKTGEAKPVPIGGTGNPGKPESTPAKTATSFQGAAEALALAAKMKFAQIADEVGAKNPLYP